MHAGEEARWPNVDYFLKRLAKGLSLALAGGVSLLLLWHVGALVWHVGVSYQITMGKVLPVGEPVSGSVLLEQGFDRVCLEPLMDPAVRDFLRTNVQYQGMHDLFGSRRVSSRILFFAGDKGPRYALVRELFINFGRPPPASPNDCWPLGRVTFDLQPASRYKVKPLKKQSADVEDFYVWMTIANRSK
jgi:hypothetical protein